MSRSNPITDLFGTKLFDFDTMRERLPKEVFEDLLRSIQEDSFLSLATADAVANAMKDWAIENGATHYTHWFQPLTNITAEKHDSFLGTPDGNGRVIMDFSGKELVKGEPDASSFPSGGLRATFEARGYTAWDCTSPAFIRETSVGKILCIPTAFYAYNGAALDKKTPLLRSMEALNREGLRLLRLLGNTTSKRVIPMVGAEQEYFIIDRSKYLRRKDLVYTGRTLFGTMPAKGQEMDDHYFGAISDRVGAFMKEVDEELWTLGVPAKTQHKEVAPGQHELASIFTTVNIAADQNQLVMETLKRIATKHDLAVLLHEKPFAGINGSGKHNNWSIMTDDGISLLDPGKTPHDNTQFLLILTAILKAVDDYAGLLRLSATVNGNDFRLGAKEAPPAIISVFLGEQLQDVIDQIVSEGLATHSIARTSFDTGVAFLPNFSKDTTDRNRTSPFAFIGNRFEFRMVGSSDSIACANTVLNTITADAFAEICSELEKVDDIITAAHELIQKYAKEHQRIIFGGNGYSKEWEEEAARRGLPNLPFSVDAIPVLYDKKVIDLFERNHVLNEPEIVARAEIRYEMLNKQIHTEALATQNIAHKQIIPAVIRFEKNLADNINAIHAAVPGCSTTTSEDILTHVSAYLDQVTEASHALTAALAEAEQIEDLHTAARVYTDKVRPAMETMRAPIDALEKIVDKTLWPFPSYGDMLFEV